ncbi:hypothetical protein [Pontibacter anaerobius]|uniref:Lipoprotein n=1 Tax=Pontibacter anaerobius TaxID=2993940 RepID=A0ABT3RKK1_9BACT|nr:hypothetical protein [Pontibacter anaerobius]MCX2741981.1 hypothetical protein [Pontibacter anaerobius]
MRSRLFLALLALMLISCADGKTSTSFDSLETMQIDSLERVDIKQELGFWEVSKASPYLGGLGNNISFAYGFAMCGDTSYCQDSKWQYGGFICTCRNLVIKRDKGIEVIKNRFELKETFAPIESRGEALSYAIIMTSNYPVFDEEYFKDEYRYFSSKPRPTAVQEFKNHYLVKLFDYKTFGCDHPYYSVLVRVDKNGDVSEYRRQAIFEDPEDDGLCRD